MEQYYYTPLPQPNSIRLIKLQLNPERGGFACSLEIANLSCPPEYIALSYVWGDRLETVPIICDGKSVQVTLNLRDALRNLGAGLTYIWADALCINQEDILERNQQVKIMSDIYSKAAVVIVWLGLDEAGDAAPIFDDIKALVDGLATLHAIGAAFQHFDAETGDLHSVLGDGQPVVSALPGALVDPNEQERSRLTRFFRLPWFSRVWVIQEVGLATYPCLMWGGLVMDWHLVGLTAMFLVRHCRLLLERLGIVVEVKRVYDLYTIHSPYIPLATFLHVLQRTRGFMATDPRDKVFSLLSHPCSRTISISTVAPGNIASFKPSVELAIQLLPSLSDKWLVKKLAEKGCSSSEPEEPRPPLLEADYNKSVEKVYRDLTLEHISRTSSLEILTAVQHDPNCTFTSDLQKPTWVPRWDVSHNLSILGLYTSNFIASGNKSAIILPPSLPSNPSALTVRGILVDIIPCHTKLLHSPSFDLSPNNTQESLNLDSAIIRSLRSTNPIAFVWFHGGLNDAPADSYPQLGWPRLGSNIVAAYRGTWVAGKELSEVDGFDREADFRSYWDRLFWGNQLDEKANGEGERGKWERYRDSATSVCDQRKFFITEMCFIGIGPGALCEGDVVAVLYGADVPFVLRKVEGETKRTDRDALGDGGKEKKDKEPEERYVVVGECYVYGLMQGQATRAGLEERDIVLI